MAEREGWIRCFAPHPFGAPFASLPASCANAARWLVEPKGSNRVLPVPQIERAPRGGPFNLAEREGFEPSVRY